MADALGHPAPKGRDALLDMQPQPMRVLRSNRSEFRLVELPVGRTRLEGRTWYEFDMHPQAYWTLWADSIIHRIHGRVLRHVKQLAEDNQATR